MITEEDIKKALEHCIEWNCADCPNREELGSGETVCRGRLLPEVLEYVAELEAKLAESEHRNKQLVDALNGKVFINYKLPMENAQLKQQLEENAQHTEQLLKENAQLRKVLSIFDDYDAKGEIVDQYTEIQNLRKQLAEKDEQLRAKIGNMKSNDFIKMCLQCGLMVDAKEKDQDKILFAVEQLEKVNKLKKYDTSIAKTQNQKAIEQLERVKHYARHIQGGLINYIDNQIKQLKEEK